MSKKWLSILSIFVLLFYFTAPNFAMIASANELNMVSSIDKFTVADKSNLSVQGSSIPVQSTKGYQNNGISLFASTTSDGIKAAGNYYNDVPDARYNPLGAAQNFHIFAEKVTISAHTNGNIATKMLEKAGSNWGTNVKSSNADGAGLVKAEIIYIQDFKEMHANPFVTRDGAGVKFVVGPDIELSSQNNAEFYLKSKHMNERKKIDESIKYFV